MLTIHFWQWPLLRHPSGQKYLQSCSFKRFTSTRKLFLLLLYGPAVKWKQMSSTREQLLHCYDPPLRLFTGFSEKLIATQQFDVLVLALLACCRSVVALVRPHSVLQSTSTSLLLTWCNHLLVLKMGTKDLTIGPKFGNQGSHKETA